MKTMTSTNHVLNAVHEDASRTINGGGKLPVRDDDGNLTFIQGQENIMHFYEPKVRQIQNAIEKNEKKLSDSEAERNDLTEELTAETLEYTKQQQTDEAEFNTTKKQFDQLEQQLDQMEQNDKAPAYADRDRSRKTGKRKGFSKFLSFMLVAFVAEIITYFATINLQKENLPVDAIMWRFAYIIVIYVFTGILFAKYLKTQIKTVKWLLVGCFMMSLVCLFHAIAVSFINIDTVSTVAYDYNLGMSGTVETEAKSESVLDNFIYNPGLIEFIIATLLVFIGEIVTIDSKNKEDNAVSLPVDEPLTIDFVAAAKENEARHIASLKTKMAKLQERSAKRTAEFNNRVNGINYQLEANELRKEQLETELENHQREMEVLLDRIVSDLSKYRDLLLSDLAFKLDVNVSSFEYEPATKKDVKNYYKIND